MKEEINKLKQMINYLNNYMKKLITDTSVNNKKTIFSGMIIKKTIDILYTAIYVLENNIISVQISLIRLLCDNCLAIESANYLSLDKRVEMILNNERTVNIEVSEEQMLTDGYLKKRVDSNYKGFARLYNYACDAVHFSKQALSTSFKNTNSGLIFNTDIGNSEFKEEILSNNEKLITLCKIIIDMLNKLS